MITETKHLKTDSSTLRAVLELATREVFEIMVNSSVETHAEPQDAKFDITSMIGLAGSLCGVISIRCTSEAARAIAAKMLGQAEVDSDRSMRDAMAEIVNMVAGNFKSKLSGSDHCMLSIPTVITGGDYQLCSVDVGEIEQLFLSFGEYPLIISMELHN
jgi:chemotaxis protein CheX